MFALSATELLPLLWALSLQGDDECIHWYPLTRPVSTAYAFSTRCRVLPSFVCSPVSPPLRSPEVPEDLCGTLNCGLIDETSAMYWPSI
ncbi:hypothetical protein SISSUDRAFT_1043842 [Sistotremastrum suecicum HHB10207 ss-3]|uniref:Secreted protein n=1 Tax=Sistotremastrum suecicum HHB10207 ss-3 TaxID=1314776 RepID=A0A166FJC6_9AGAM|nr:hypothetical protein SISSUDRAFT_1043842 [Sistotremastrum suecicum HHB10207 ss-3]